MDVILEKKRGMAQEYLGDEDNAEVIEDVIKDMRERRGQTVTEEEDDDDSDAPEPETETEEETTDV